MPFSAQIAFSDVLRRELLLIAAMAAHGYWTSPTGKTPAATLSAALQREIVVKKDRARFQKTGPGRFALA